jgi:hypothetical protein
VHARAGHEAADLLDRRERLRALAVGDRDDLEGDPGSTSTPMPLWVTTVARRAPGGTLCAIAARTPGPTSTS